MKLRQSVFLVLLSSVSFLVSAEITVDNSWVAAPPPGSRVLAAYMNIENPDSSERRLVSVSSAQFAEVEIHNSTMKNGMMMMEPLSVIVIPANGSVELSSGGLHMMLMDPVKYFKAGDTVELKLNFEQGPALNVQVPVKAR